MADAFALVVNCSDPSAAPTRMPINPDALTAAAVPSIISTRQFFQQLAVDGDCTQDEALGYVQTGALPQALSDAIAQLPTAARFAVKMKVIGANEFDRNDPAVAQLGALLSKDATALDRIWRLASAL